MGGLQLWGHDTGGAGGGTSVRGRCLVAPAGFEHFFRELCGLVATGPPDPAQLPSIAERYGLRFGQPDWLEDVIARYGLTPPPGA